LLTLDWGARIQVSYLELIERLKKTRALTMRDLTFNAFAGITVTWQDLGVRPADVQSFL
jgi:hypothetical protein